MTMLLHMAAWATRDRLESLQHVHDCIKSGLDPADVPRGYDMATGKYANANFLRAQAIGFDRKEINNLLGKKDNRLIEIPAGTLILNVAEILQKVIKQVSPPFPPRDLSVVSLKKRFTLEPKHYRDEDLTDDDWNLLESIKCDSPIADWFPMTQAQFDELKALFDTAPNKPEWGLSAVTRDYYSEAKVPRNTAFNNHLNNIETLVKGGQLNLIQATGDPIKLSNTQHAIFNAFFTIDDARAYLKTCGFQLVQIGNEPDKQQSEPATEAQDSKDKKGEHKRRNRLYAEVMEIKNWQSMTSASILTHLRTVAGTTTSCVLAVNDNGIDWKDALNDKQITQIRSFKAGVARIIKDMKAI